MEHLHERNLTNLLAALDAERWTQADVAPERQADIERLQSGKALLVSVGSYGTFSPRDLQQQEGEGDGPRRSSLTSSDGAGTAGAGGGEEDGDVAAATGGGRRKSSSKAEPAEVVVGDGRYKVAWSALLLLEMLVGCLNVAADFPNLSLDVMQRIMDLLRVRA